MIIPTGITEEPYPVNLRCGLRLGSDGRSKEREAKGNDRTPALEAHLVGPFREGLREMGYVEGQNIVVEYRWAEGNYERFPASSRSCSPRRLLRADHIIQ